MKDILLEDLQMIAQSNVPFQEFQNTTILITGATGLIGSLLVKTLLFCNKFHNLDIRVFAVVRDQKKAEEIFQSGDKALRYIIADFEKDDINIDVEIDYIIHAAAITTSKIMVENPVGTINTAVKGTSAMLELAVIKQIKSMVYISSMEVYGQPDDSVQKVKENDLGYIDLWNVRSSYPEGKRICECMCAAYASQFQVNVKSARLAQTFGPGILKSENRVFAQFAKSVLSGKDIVLRTTGNSEGNYVYTRDAVTAILLLLLRGESGQAYNVSNEASHTTIREMAELVAGKIGEKRIKVVMDIPEDGSNKCYAAPVKLWMDSSKMRKLGWVPEVGLEEAYCRMIEWMKMEKEARED